MPPLLDSLPLWALFAYLLGAVPVGLAIGRLSGVDLRDVGSGNIGATNAVRALGRGRGLLVFVLDVTKAATPVWLASQEWALGSLEDDGFALAVVAAAAFGGHLFPVYLKFRGGKGVACALGVFLVLEPFAAVAGFLLYLQTMILARISAVASLTGATTMLLYVLFASDTKWSQLLVILVSGLVWWRHRPNLKELFERYKAAKNVTPEPEGDNENPRAD